MARCNASQTSAASAFLGFLLGEASVKTPASVDRLCVETPVLASEGGAAVTVLDWGQEASTGFLGATLNVTLGFTPSKVHLNYTLFTVNHTLLAASS
jgi:hypothetical protein